ncbi:Ig-like domain-containing protein [Enterobacter asburiae]|nr:Ig-like domain-containing protein [Enterobacter asburiae]
MKFNLTLDVTKNNAYPDGEDFNTVKAMVVDENGQPASDVVVLFNSSGNAHFSNGNIIFRGTTDIAGVCLANIIDSSAESISISAQAAGTDVKYVMITFTNIDKQLEIQSINNENGVFPGDTFDIAWTGASFSIKTTGGSGDLSWSVSGGAGLAITQEGGSYAVFTFRSAELNTNYLIIGKDKVTMEEISYCFALSEFVLSWLNEINAVDLFLAGDIKKLRSKSTLLKIYQQWGSISSYNSGLNVFWTDNFSYNSETEVLSAELVSLVNGEILQVTATNYKACLADFKLE